MSISNSEDSDYNVEQYFKPTVKRSTYSNNDSYLSEGTDSEPDQNESEEEVLDIKEQIKGESQCVVKESTNHDSEQPRSTNRLIIYVSNLSQDTTRSMLEAFFSDAGPIKSVRIPKKRLSNFAFVEMKDMDGFKNGLKFDGKELDGKKLKVQQGSKNKKHVSNKSKNEKKKRFKIFEQKKQNRLNNKGI